MPEPARVHVRAEDAHPAVAASKRLHALEYRLAVVQGRVARLHLDRSVGNDPGPPPLAVLPLHAEHVIAEDVAEAEVAEVDVFAPASGDEFEFDIAEHVGIGSHSRKGVRRASLRDPEPPGMPRG